MAEQATARRLEIGNQAEMDGIGVERGSFLVPTIWRWVCPMQSNVLALKPEHDPALSKRRENASAPLQRTR